MSLKMILFDLDGTLLPMDQDVFVKGYFKSLTDRLAPYGFEPKGLIDSIWHGIAAMVKNDGSRSNEAAFWADFHRCHGQKGRDAEPAFRAFYEEEFDQARVFCGYNPQAADAVKRLKAAGYRVALATNPIFPEVAQHIRLRWAGLEPEMFELITTYESIGLSKPNPAYYKEVARRLGVEPGECMMVGNDVSEDMVAQSIGMQVFLLTDCLINTEGKDISAYPQGSFPELLDFVLGRKGNEWEKA